MTTSTTLHPWSSEALFSKALLYVEEMERYPAEDWRFGFWASLSLELIARAALSHISPTLLANRKDWHNVIHALGRQATSVKFSPMSVNISEVLSMLTELVPGFIPELSDFCVRHVARRNSELHTGEEVFAGLGTSSWLPHYYASCKVLLESMGKTLSEVFEDPKKAEELVTALQDTVSKVVHGDIAAHRKLWGLKEKTEQDTLVVQATSWATRQAGHRTKCPACGSPSLIHGSSYGPVTTQIGEDEVVQKQTMLPAAFECIACRLRISGFSKLSAAGLGDAFTSTSTFSIPEYFGLHTDQELEEARAEGPEPMYEEDFNEY
jgi:hypothetical protein